MRPVASLIDANVPIYAAGEDHPYKAPCSRILLTVSAHPRAFITDVEVLQEVMHHYIRSRRWMRGGREALQEFAELMRGRTEPVYSGDVDMAISLADRHQGIASRDYLHAAVMRRLGVERIISADRDFDRLPGITRLDPSAVDEWEGSVLSVNGGPTDP